MGFGNQGKGGRSGHGLRRFGGWGFNRRNNKDSGKDKKKDDHKYKIVPYQDRKTNVKTSVSVKEHLSSQIK